MEASAMPLMLGDAMDVAMSSNVLDGVDVDDVDLFGGPVPDLAALPARPPPSKQLRKRVNELRIRGCCQNIAWSRQGTIASIGEDGYALEMRYLHTNPRDASWALSEATPCRSFSTSPGFAGGPIVHLAWSGTTSPELAIIDAVGRVCIFTFSVNLNRPYSLRLWDADPVDDLNAVVGCYWLPLVPAKQPFNVFHGPAIRESNGYRFETTLVHAVGPNHPNSAKSALLCVTSRNVLKLFYVQTGNKVQDASLELESFASSDDLTTHASLCSERGNYLLIALATASQQLKVVRVHIQWGLPQQDKQQQQQQQQQASQSVPLSPILMQKPAAMTSWLPCSGSESQTSICMDKLSHIEMLPSAAMAPNQQQPWAPPLVLTVRSYLPPLPTHSPYAGASAAAQEPQSIVDRWELLSDSPPQPLHAAFEQVGSKAQHAASQGLTRLHRLEPLMIPKVIVSVSVMHLGKVICFFFSDGTVQYRDRFTMQEIYNEPNLDRISILQQANFQFTDLSPCLSAALSPTACSYVQMKEDGKIKWNRPQYLSVDSLGSSLKDGDYAAVMAGLAMAVSTASYYQINYDDVLATARQFAHKPRFGYDWMMETVRLMKINVDYSADAHHDQLVRNNSLQLGFSILNHMGFRGVFQRREFCGKFANMALNMRNVVVLITIAANTAINYKERMNPLDEPDVVEALLGCVKWSIDLLTYIADCLFNLLEDPQFMALLTPQRFNELMGYLRERNEVALHLVLCSSTRGFMSAACRRVLHMHTISSRATQYYEQLHQRQQQQQQNSNKEGSSPMGGHHAPLSAAYQKMQQYTSTSLIKVEEFEALLATLGQEIRQMYQTRVAQHNSQKSEQQQQQAPPQDVMKRFQAHCELSLLLANDPPVTFQPVLAKFFQDNVRTFRAQTDPARLYFADYRLLEVDDDEGTLQARRQRPSFVDVFKRVELVEGPPPVDIGSLGSGSGSGSSTVNPRELITANVVPGQSGAFAGIDIPRLWRRCTRCTAIMEDASGFRPGYTFVLSQQRKCSCGGSWELLPPPVRLGPR